MRKIILGIVCLFLSFYASAQSYLETHTSGHLTVVITDTMYHDSTICESSYYVSCTITVDSSYAGETIRVIDTVANIVMDSFYNVDGVSPWITPTHMIFSTAAPDFGVYASYIRTAPFYIKIINNNDTIRELYYDSLLVTNPCSYAYAQGRVYMDNNSNCIFDSGDIGISSLDLDFSEIFSGPCSWYIGGGTSYDGGFSAPFLQSWLTTYTVAIPPYYAFIFPASPCFTTSYTLTALPDSGIDFPLQCTSNLDVQCYAGSPGNVRLHRPFYMQPYVSNTGCDSASGQLTFIKDSRVSYDSAMSTNPAMIVSGDTLIWNYSGLTSLAAGAYWNSFLSNIYLIPDSTLAVGDTLCFRIYTNVPTADIDPFNNDYTICLPVVYSYDPNEKEVSPKGTGPEGYIDGHNDTLTYTLHFQNTGSAEADNIVVIDTLDSHINAHTLKILGTSNNMMPQWLAPNIVAFNFNNIFLPDSTDDEPGSHGFVRFSVMLDSGLTTGTQIKNTSYIYFDANPAVVTNTTLNTLLGPTSVQQVTTSGDITLYPNPASDVLNLTISKGTFTELTIFNNVGASVLHRSLTGTNTSVSVASLPAGMYYVHVRSDNNMRVLKFVKE